MVLPVSHWVSFVCWVSTCATFSLELALWFVGCWLCGVCLFNIVCVCGFVCLSFLFLPPSTKIGAGEMWWLGGAPRKGVSVGRGAELHLLLVLSRVEICQVFLPVQP